MILFIVILGYVLDINNTDSQNEEVEVILASDYSLSENWLSLPVESEKNVDVFYLCSALQ